MTDILNGLCYSYLVGGVYLKSIGVTALITLLAYIIFISLAFWCIQELHIERYIPMRARQVKLLIILLSILLGYNASEFFMSLIDNIRNLIFLVK